jgi:phospholipid-binding lipoprotein MlaA
VRKTRSSPAPAADSGAPEDDPLFDEDDDFDLLEDASNRDPFEGLNRDVFGFNRTVDRIVFDPVTRGYQFAIPAPGRHAVYRAFQNLDSPMILVNHMAQFRVHDAASTLTRFVINSSIGVVGLFDPAASYSRCTGSRATSVRRSRATERRAVRS